MARNNQKIMLEQFLGRSFKKLFERITLLLFTLALVTVSGWAAHTRVELKLESDTVAPGASVWAGIHMKMDPHWHTYWKNGGDSGMATSIQWNLPDGVTAGEIQWPVPEIYEDKALGMITYVYHGEATLLVPLSVSDSLEMADLKISADVSWLECEVSCVPGSQTVSGSLKIGDSDSVEEPEWLVQARQNLPQPPDFNVTGEWMPHASDDEGAFVIHFEPEEDSEGLRWDYWPYPNEIMEIGTRSEKVESETGWTLKKEVFKFDGDWPESIPGGLLVMLSADSVKPQKAFAIESFTDSLKSNLTSESDQGVRGSVASTSVADSVQDSVQDSSVVEPEETNLSDAESGSPNLLWMLIQGFLGGMILNIMPCVLPVISLKILGFVEKSRNDPASIRRMGWFYTSGVVFSFMVMAGLVIGIQQAGKLASWGMQFQNPQFVMILTILVLLVALNLFGVFEVSLSSGTVSAMNEAASKEGGLGAFLHGILATALATPCTAPFLGAALGFAFTQPPMVTAVMFLAVGLGLSAPYLVLSYRPDWLKVLPKPGAWMERFKVALGFPMLGAGIWLFTVVSLHLSNEQLLWFGLSLIVLSMAAWTFGQFIQRGIGPRWASVSATLLLTLLAFGYGMEKEVHWRAVGTESGSQSASANAAAKVVESGGIDWYRWSPEDIQQAREKGNIVFVDFTASWCWTCKVNKKTSVEVESVRQRFEELNVVAFRADNTKASPEIAEELRKYNRAGVPLNLVYPADPTKDPIVLPEILTPGIVINALKQAADS